MATEFKPRFGSDREGEHDWYDAMLHRMRDELCRSDSSPL